VDQIGGGPRPRFIIRDDSSGQQTVIESEHFFILEQLSQHESAAELADNYSDYFNTELSPDHLKSTIEEITRAGLWGRDAREHALVGPLIATGEVPGGRRRAIAQKVRQHNRKQRRANALPGRPGRARLAGQRGARLPGLRDEAEEVAGGIVIDHDSLIEEPGAPDTTRGFEVVDEPEVPADGSGQPESDATGAGMRERPRQNGQGRRGGSAPRGVADRRKGMFPQWKLADADRFVSITLLLVRPFRFLFIWSIPLLLVASGFILAKHTANFLSEFDRIVGALSFLTRVGVSLLTINLASTIVRGLTAANYGMRIYGFGVRLVLWLLPRFILAAKIEPDTPRRSQLWVAASPLLVKLFLLGAGVLLWYITRATDNSLSHFFFWLAAMAAGSFLLTAIPLFPAAGYQLLAIWANEPNLRQKAIGSLKAGLTGKPVPEGGGFSLALFGLCTLLFLGLIFGLVVYLLGVVSKQYFQTTGIIFATLFGLFVLYQVKRNGAAGNAGQGPRGRSAAGVGPGAGPGARRGVAQRRAGGRQMQSVQPGGRGAARRKPEPAAPSLVGRLVRYGLLAAFVAVMFLPYSYEISGPLQIRPVSYQEITTDVSGIIEEVYYDGGESLAKGALIGRLSTGDAERQMSIRQARIEEQQAIIDRLLAKPTAEEVEVAKRTLEVKRTRADYSAKDLARKEAVFKKGVISEEEVYRAREEHEVNLGNVLEAEAQLTLVMAGATPEELAAAYAELQRWTEERNLYKDAYEKSFLYMPFDGKIVSQLLKQRTGQFLNKGEVFAKVENTSKMLGEVEVPEFDTSLIKLGAEVRVRLLSYHDEIFSGVVQSVNTSVEQRSFGNVVKVITLLGNDDQRLKSGMTGYAKITGETRPVWEVLFLTVWRFVQVEMWSWVP
jgi:putative peptide zinc metalloprotease protein